MISFFFHLLYFLFFLFFFFFNDTATTEIYTLSLHDALPIPAGLGYSEWMLASLTQPGLDPADRKSTRLNSSHRCISYAVFCLKKKKDVVDGRHVRTVEDVEGFEDEAHSHLLADRYRSRDARVELVDRFFVVNVTETAGIYTLSLHDALPI